MSNSYAKAKSVGKKVTPKGPGLDHIVTSTMKLVSDVVGATLGPGGMPVLIERQEHALGPIITKDGVTVFRSLGFEDSTQQVVLEAARDAAVRTAAEAGDGTTTAAVLSEAIVRNIGTYTKSNPRVSPQRVVRTLERLFADTVAPSIQASVLRSVKAAAEEDEAFETRQAEERQAMLYAVAKTSANGDAELADKVLDCHDLVGDDGNVTIVEMNGPSGYEVEQVVGYSIGVGYEDSCGRFYQVFVNDRAHQRAYLEKPVFLLYHGKLTEIQMVTQLFYKIANLWQHENFYHNVVLIATGFSESVLGALAVNFDDPNTINVLPVLAPINFDPNSQLNFLEDVSALTGAKVLSPTHDRYNLDKVEVEDLGYGPGLVAFESGRYRSTIIGRVQSQAVEEAIILRADELRTLIAGQESIAERRLAEERLGKLTGGIARLKIFGASNGETKEKRDRAEDAVCAVRGAVRHGALPGGGWMFMRLVAQLLAAEMSPEDKAIATQVLVPAMLEIPKRILRNAGLLEDEADKVIAEVSEAAAQGVPFIYDALDGKMVNALEAGILDSTPAVLESVRNSLSIASILGLLGGTVVFKRDHEVDRQEAQDINEFTRSLEFGANAADQRP